MYNIGLCAGRYQHIHNGHTRLIKTALGLCDRVLLLIGEPAKSGEVNNPFSYNERKLLIEKVFYNNVLDGSLVVAPFTGMTEAFDEYAKMLFYDVKANMGVEKPDIIFYGADKRFMEWYQEGDLEGVSEFIDARADNVSATLVRKMLLEDNFYAWNKLVPAELDSYRLFKKLRERIVEVNG